MCQKIRHHTIVSASTKWWHQLLAISYQWKNL